jgi:hypothetical protein
MATKSVVFSVRLAPSDRDAIARRAREQGISQSELVVRSILGRVDDRLEARIERLESVSPALRGFRRS